MKHIRLLSALVLFVAAICPALAAETVFPPGVRVGITPLVGLVGAKTFVGFETEDHGVKVLMAELPPEAYGEVVTAFKANPAGTNGIKPESIETAAGVGYYTAENAKNGATNVRRYSMILPGGAFSGYIAVQVPENASKIYTDEAIRQMFASAAVRKQVPVEEKLGLLPFKISDLGDFKNVRTLAVGSAVLLADSEENSQRRGDALHGAQPDGIYTGTAGRSRPVRPGDRDQHSGRARGTDDDVRSDPHRRHARL